MYEGVVQDLLDELQGLPGVGPKSAQRIVFYLMGADPVRVKALGESVLALRERMRWCEVCSNLTDQERCQICRDPRRSDAQICVVEHPRDVIALERTGFRGRYQVLGGSINPIEGIGPDQLHIRQLMQRLAAGETTEVVLATDPDTEGEATATYLAFMIKPMQIRVTRPALGLPMGTDLEFADETTLARAIEGRTAL